MTNLASLRTLWAALWSAVVKLGAGIAWLSARVFGRWKWQPPSWIAWTGGRVRQGGRYLVADKKRAGIAFLVLASMLGATVWYETRPVPHYVTYKVNAPGLTEYNDRGISSIKPLTVTFDESAAPLQ